AVLRSMFFVCWLLVAGCWLLVAGCWLLVAVAVAVCSLLFVVICRRAPVPHFAPVATTRNRACASSGSIRSSTAAPCTAASEHASSIGSPHAKYHVSAAAKLSPAPYAPTGSAARGGESKRVVPLDVMISPPFPPSVSTSALGADR